MSRKETPFTKNDKQPFGRILQNKYLKMPCFTVKPIEKAPPYVTAQSWAIIEGFSKVRLSWKFSSAKREIASLTKMMVLYTWIQLWKQLNINPESTDITIPSKAVAIWGTSAGLKVGESLYAIDLFYALMLPSGNDAGYTLAHYFGNLIIKN